MKYKNNKGVTLVEVLVSIVITILVMAYGLNLFIASWKLEVESKEYNEVLQIISSKIEYYKQFVNPAVQIEAKGVSETITLSSGRTLQLNVRVYEKNNGSVPLSVTGKWPSSNLDKNEKIETIAVNTFLGTDINII